MLLPVVVNMAMTEVCCITYGRQVCSNNGIFMHKYKKILAFCFECVVDSENKRYIVAIFEHLRIIILFLIVQRCIFAEYSAHDRPNALYNYDAKTTN